MPPKKSVSATHSSSFDRWHIILLWVCILLAGVWAGSFLFDSGIMGSFQKEGKAMRSGDETFVSMKNISDEMFLELGKGQEMVVLGGKTWISVEGTPVELLVVNDKNCGEVCAPDQAVGFLRQALTPALLVRTVDINSAEGESLKKKFLFTSVPSYILGESAGNLMRGGKRVLDEIAPVLIEKDGYFLIQSEKVGFPVGKYLTVPDIDKKGEPTLGDGSVDVVEFTDFQCPFCKSLHVQNKELIKRLTGEGKIRYIVKDFPLDFHKESLPLHVVANCVQKLAGDEQYFALRGKFFDAQSEWAGKGVDEAKAFGLEAAKEFVSDTDALASCVADLAGFEEIAKDIEEGRALGVSGTPTLFIGTQRMPGAINPQMFEKAVKGEER